MPIPVETAAGSRDQRQDVFGSGTPCASGTVRWTGEVAAEKILLPLDADDQYGGAARHSAPTPGVGSWKGWPCVWATLASTSTRDGQPFKAHLQGWLMYVV